MSVAPGQADGCIGEGDDAFAAPGKAEPFAGRRLHRYALDRKPYDLGDARTHGVTMRADARRLAYHGDVKMRDAPAAGLHAFDGEGEKTVGGSAAPLRIARGEMHADVTL